MNETSSSSKKKIIRIKILPIRGVVSCIAILFILLLNLYSLSNGLFLSTNYLTSGELDIDAPYIIALPKGRPQHYQHHQLRRPRIGFLSSYIPSDMWSSAQREKKVQVVFDHLTNRACYCHLWHYDCILNQTREMTTTAVAPSTTPTSNSGPVLSKDDDDNNDNNNNNNASSSSPPAERWWLRFGAWDRVAHLQAALARYDWVLYGDLDYIIKDMARPLESFLFELELSGKSNVSVILPSDANKGSTPNIFSSYAVMVKNSPVGWKVLEHWREFAKGVCPNGNFFSADKKRYDWIHSDQPGLWYALMKTHMDLFPNSALPPSIVECSTTTGFIDLERTGPLMGLPEYFTENGLKLGNYGLDLDAVPDDQVIIFSRSASDSMSGLGTDHNFVYNRKTGAELWKYAFALHQNQPSGQWDIGMQRQLDMCKNTHGCFAKSVVLSAGNGRIEFGCNETEELYFHQ